MGHIYHHGAGCSSCEGSTKAVLKYKKNHSSSSSPGAGCLSCKGSTKTPVNRHCNRARGNGWSIVSFKSNKNRELEAPSSWLPCLISLRCQSNDVELLHFQLTSISTYIADECFGAVVELLK
uniref:Uncharacterized protein n=1 Tax=Vespula pensylvanica TaxID=30213 RepID=A0A834KW66_VESPE|nr:hypothetical protein H0235_012902 [Vespula pensylvanica]